MPEFRTPKEYSPEFCGSVIANMQKTLESAINALTLVNNSQKELTFQTIEHLNDSFEDIKAKVAALEKNQEHIDDQTIKLLENFKEKELKPALLKLGTLENKIINFKIKFYASGIAAMIFLMGFAFTIFKFTQTVQPATP